MGTRSMTGLLLVIVMGFRVRSSLTSRGIFAGAFVSFFDVSVSR